MKQIQTKRVSRTSPGYTPKFNRKSFERKNKIQFMISLAASAILAFVFYMLFFYILTFPVLESLAFAVALSVFITEFMDNKIYNYQKTSKALVSSLLLPLIILIIYLVLYHTGFKL